MYAFLRRRKNNFFYLSRSALFKEKPEDKRNHESWRWNSHKTRKSKHSLTTCEMQNRAFVRSLRQNETATHYGTIPYRTVKTWALMASIEMENWDSMWSLCSRGSCSVIMRLFLCSQMERTSPGVIWPATPIYLFPALIKMRSKIHTQSKEQLKVTYENPRE